MNNLIIIVSLALGWSGQVWGMSNAPISGDYEYQDSTREACYDAYQLEELRCGIAPGHPATSICQYSELASNGSTFSLYTNSFEIWKEFEAKLNRRNSLENRVELSDIEVERVQDLHNNARPGLETFYNNLVIIEESKREMLSGQLQEINYEICQDREELVLPFPTY